MKQLLKCILFTTTFFAAYSCGETDAPADYPDDLYVDPLVLEFDSVGGYKFLNISSRNVAWQITNDIEWVEVSPENGFVTTPVKVVAKPNDSGYSRTDSFIVKSTFASHPSEYHVKITQKSH